jgi:hypothetical protein
MVLRLGQRFPSVSLSGLLYLIVQEVMVVSKIGGIESHEEYNRLSKNGADTEFSLLQKLQETMQKNTKNLHYNVRDLVIQFFKEDTNNKKFNHVKYYVFIVGGSASIVADDHHVFLSFNALPRPTIPTLACPCERPPACTCVSQPARPRTCKREPSIVRRSAPARAPAQDCAPAHDRAPTFARRLACCCAQEREGSY